MAKRKLSEGVIMKTDWISSYDKACKMDSRFRFGSRKWRGKLFAERRQ
jgi:hypothetical protein